MKIVPWNLNETETRDLFRALRFRYFKWDVEACGKRLVLPESVVLTPAEHQQAVEISERFAAILIKLETALCQRPDLLAKLGMPPDVIPLVTHAQPTDLQLARYDLFLTPDNRWMVSEFNEDVPGGFNEAVGLPDLLGRTFNGASFASDLRQAMTDAFDPYDVVAFMYATGYSEDLQHMLIVQEWLEEKGHTTLMASPAHLRGGWRGPRVFGQRIHAAFRFYPGEWYTWLGNRRHWDRMLNQLQLMNPLRRLIRQSKRLYAYWLDPTLLDADDIRFLETHAPRTLPYESSRAHDEPRDRWVLKHAFGRMGDTVIMGNLVNDIEWREALAEADRAPHQWLLQERFEVAAHPNHTKVLYPTIGTYMVNHRFAGYYSRADIKPFINHEAYHVPTLVEPA